MLGRDVVWVCGTPSNSIPISDRENSNLQSSFIAEFVLTS